MLMLFSLTNVLLLLDRKGHVFARTSTVEGDAETIATVDLGRITDITTGIAPSMRVGKFRKLQTEEVKSVDGIFMRAKVLVKSPVNSVGLLNSQKTFR